MNYETYINLMLSGNSDDAHRYKAALIPNHLYKYYSLGDDPALNELKFETLSRGEVYLSKMEDFNDPFEGKALYYNEDLLNEKGWDCELIKGALDEIRRNFRIACFNNADEKEQNMPMWAYYANNHQGFCVDHTFNTGSMTLLYPVSYEPHRISANSLITSFIADMLNSQLKGIPLSQEAKERMLLLFLSSVIKHKSWEHEREIRAVVPSANDNSQYMSAPPINIYVGLNCSPEHCSRLVDIAKGFAPNCNIYKMTLEDNASDSVELKEIPLL